MQTKKAVLSQRPKGEPKVTDFEIMEAELPPLEDGQVLIQIEHLSIDAFIRTTLDGPQGHHGTMDLGTPVIALGVGRVLDSRFEGLQQGDAAFGPFGAQTRTVVPGNILRKLDESAVPARAYLGALGMTTGLTAYAGMICVGEVKAGDTVVVSAAAGAVGSIACQIGKIKGARVIGIAGGQQKCNFLVNEIGCDAAVDYKAGHVAEAIAAQAPDGLDLFFDNVGGEILDAALDNMAKEARVVICGAISQYNDLQHVRGPALYLRIPERNASMLGFTVDHYASQFPTMEAELAGWMRDGQLKMPEQIVEGIERFPEAIVMLMNGGNRGKLLVAP